MSCGSELIVLWHPVFFFFFFKQKTAYEMRISDWSSDVCSSDLAARRQARYHVHQLLPSHRPSQHPRLAGKLSMDDPFDLEPLAVGARKHGTADRQSVVEGKSMSVRVDLGGRRIIQQKKKMHKTSTRTKSYKTIPPHN